MSFRSWVIGLLGGQEVVKSLSGTASKALPLDAGAGDPMEEEAAGLNFRTAIAAHQKWKQRLQAVVDGTSVEVLSVPVVCRDDQCVLGKWIHGPSATAFAAMEQFVRLKKNHAFFHMCAGKVLSLAQEKNHDAARRELESGNYARVSQDVVLDLATMYNSAQKARV